MYKHLSLISYDFSPASFSLSELNVSYRLHFPFHVLFKRSSILFPLTLKSDAILRDQLLLLTHCVQTIAVPLLPFSSMQSKQAFDCVDCLI